MNHPSAHGDAALEELLGAYALDALDADEADAVERFLARTPDAAAEVEQLRRAAAWIGATEAISPPPRVRAAVLGAARSPARDVTNDEPLATYVAVTSSLDALVDELPAGSLGRRTANGLSVHELVIHLASMESLLATTLGVPTEAGLDESDIEARTAAFVERYRDRPIEHARAMWRRSVEAVRRWAEQPENARARVACYDLSFERDDLLLARSFETWIHSDDVRRALGRPPEPPEPRILHRMAGMSVKALPMALESTGKAHRGRSAWIVLTGRGGGSWLIPLGRGHASEPADVVMTADTVDWCLLVAERLAPDRLAYEAEGEAWLVPDLAEAASAFTTL